jgi:hypothetical protein
MRDVSLEQLPGWETVLGLQLENLVLNNIHAVARRLRLGRTPLLAAAPFLQRATKRKRGCQVDLLISTKHSLYVVEVKRRRRIGREVIDEVKEKLRCLPASGERSVRTALVYDGQLVRGLESEGFFDFVVPLSDLLAPPG